MNLEIKDTGIGISPENLNKIFDRFYQVDQSLNRTYQGSGLGLILVKNFVDLMQGTIDVESRLGEGTIFKIAIPFKPSDEFAQARALENVTKQYPKLNVLIAEDNEISQLLMHKQLERFSYDADIASNGLEVLAMLEKKEYDLIFMDVQMPELDGVETTEKIRASAITQPIIVAITANALKEDQDKCLEAGMNDYLSKPTTLESLENMIEKWF